MSTVGSKFWLLPPNNKQNLNLTLALTAYTTGEVCMFFCFVAHDTHHTATHSLPPHTLTAHNGGKFGCKGRRHTSVSKSYNLSFLFLLYFLHQGRKLFLSNTVCKAHGKLKHGNIKSKHARCQKERSPYLDNTEHAQIFSENTFLKQTDRKYTHKWWRGWHLTY